MRFGSKHRYFKRVIRKILNFINVLKSLGEKHELFQSYIRLGSDLRIDVDVHEIGFFNIDLFDKNIQRALRNAKLSHSIQECMKVIVRGTDYVKGDIVAIRQD